MRIDTSWLKISKNIFRQFLLLTCIMIVSSYNTACPNLPQRSLRANGFCPSAPKTYACMFDTNDNEYIESCNTVPDYLSPGEKYVLTGQRRNVLCDENTYQPFSLWSNVSGQCLYDKSACSEEGQTVFNNGSTTEDRSCRCDYTMGYDFVTPPKSRCYCIPSKEDCSCYIKQCANHYFLNSDYECILKYLKENKDTVCVPVAAYQMEEKEILLNVTILTEINIKDQIRRGPFVVVAIILTAIIFIGINLTSMCIIRQKDLKIKLVAAIDIGTTYSGYASSTVEAFKRDAMDIRVNPGWFSGYRDLSSMQTPTCVLLKQNRDLNQNLEFVALGYDAQNQYAEIVHEKESNDYIFLEKFKMTLYENENISDETVIEDTKGNKIPATIVFTFILSELMKPILKHYSFIKAYEIQWVVTVPAIWSHKAKDFMRNCAEKAGIPKDRLLIALEPEAVSVYFQYLLSRPQNTQLTGIIGDVHQIDSNYLVVDIGGGTVDITAHKKSKDGELEELCKPAGDYLGGTLVDKDFENILKKIAGNEVMCALRNDYPDSYNDIIRELENFKTTLFSTKREKAYFKIPSNTLNNICKKYKQKYFTELVEESIYKTVISVKEDKMCIVRSFFIELLTSIVSKIIAKIKIVLQKIEPIEIKTFFVVGGFSQSQIVKSELETSFPNVRIIIPPNPDDANVAVVKGAVLYGHRPNFITSRLTQYTYGRLVQPVFIEGKHDPKKREIIDGIPRCKDVFEVLVKKNKPVKVGQTIKKEYEIPNHSKEIAISVYITKKENVMYVDDEGCKPFCELRVNIPEITNNYADAGIGKRKQLVIVHFEFGSTEFKVTAVDKKTRKYCHTVCRLK